MNRRGLGLVAGTLLFALGRTSATVLPAPATGADVDESRVTKILYVDPAHTEAADDAKHGTVDQPFATLGFACEAAAKAKDAGTGVKIILAAGTYREEAIIRPPRAGAADTDAPLVIEAAEREQAVIDGADTEGWSPSTWTAENGHWTHPWPFHRSVAAAHSAGSIADVGGEVYRRGDLVIVNGVLMRQVMSAAVSMSGGEFWVRQPVADGGRHGHTISANVTPLVEVQPPSGTELADSIIQVGVRAHGLTITGRRNVVVRGLLIQHATDPGSTGEGTAGLVLNDCANVLVEDVLSQWNDGAGLMISGHGDAARHVDFTLRRVRLLHNGGSGLEVIGVRNLLAEDNETSFNNFRGEWAGWVDPQGPAAVRAEEVQGSTWRRQHVIGNACRGLWWTGGNADVTIEDSVVRGNAVSGMCVENNAGPAVIRRCLVAGTKSPPSVRDHPVAVGGLLLVGTRDVTLESNIFADNAGTQLGLSDEPGAPPRLAQQHVYRHNVFYAGSADASLYRLAAADSALKDESERYYATLDSQENAFWNPLKTDVFDEYAVHPGNRKTPAVYTSRSLKLDGWQAGAPKDVGTRIEINSRWEDPMFVDPAEGDYRLKAASPVVDWNLPSDEVAAGQ